MVVSLMIIGLRDGLNLKGTTMSTVINCECGLVIQAQTDDALVEATMRHVEQDHPELVGKIGHEDILNWAEEAS